MEDIPSPVFVEFTDSYLLSKNDSPIIEIQYTAAEDFWFYEKEWRLRVEVNISNITKVYTREDYPEYYL